MIRPKDSREFAGLLSSLSIDFLVVGAHALAFHGHPRSTGDIDLLIRVSPVNAKRLVEALERFGFGSLALNKADFLKDNQTIQLGRAPQRIDILTEISGVSFEEAWAGKEAGELDGLPVWFLGRDDLIRNKLATGRAKDRGDVESLEGG